MGRAESAGPRKYEYNCLDIAEIVVDDGARTYMKQLEPASVPGV